MKTVAIDGFGNHKVLDYMPQTGHRVDMGYEPSPKVIRTLEMPESAPEELKMLADIVVIVS
jgi:hypothetical protein